MQTSWCKHHFKWISVFTSSTITLFEGKFFSPKSFTSVYVSFTPNRKHLNGDITDNITPNSFHNYFSFSHRCQLGFGVRVNTSSWSYVVMEESERTTTTCTAVGRHSNIVFTNTTSWFKFGLIPLKWSDLYTVWCDMLPTHSHTCTAATGSVHVDPRLSLLNRYHEYQHTLQ